jgi:hypothetical protein
MNIDQEQIYSLIKEKKWSQLLGLIDTYSKDTALEKDQLIIDALKFFEDQFFQYLDNNLKNDDSQEILETINILHTNKKYQFREEYFDRVVNILEERRIAPIIKQIDRLIQTKKWFDLINVIHKYSSYQFFLKNQSIVNSLEIFEVQFCEDLESNLECANNQSVLEIIFQLHKGRIYQLSDHTFTQTVAKLAKIYEKKGSTQEAYNFAQLCPKNSICAEIIKSYKESIPRVIEHSQSRKIQLTENQNISNVDYTISLFRSPQEFDFFMAVRYLYQHYTIYPNVALSCVIDSKKIRSQISKEEYDFFFKGIIDCVVFDQHNNYKPLWFFELDSSYHDAPEQKQKDEYKDNILSKAGHKLYRIRKIDNSQSKEEFIQLIRELTRGKNNITI